MSVVVLVATAVLFAGVGLIYASGLSARAGREEYIAARGEIGFRAGAATLFASAMGPWILFGPPEAATWGGLPAVIGYALGSVLPVLAYIPLGLRMRRGFPAGYTITEYVRHRYGRRMHVLVLAIVLFFLTISLCAQITGAAFLLQLVSGTPLWVTAGIVLLSTLAYTLLGGLRTSIFTDGLQVALIAPLLLFLILATIGAAGGVADASARVMNRAPRMLDWTYGPGLEGGLALIIGIGSASLFNQGTWQRVYALDGTESFRRSFLVTSVANGLIVFVMGAFGLAAVGMQAVEPASTALFNVLLKSAPSWTAVLLIVLGTALVMSSADTLMNAISSIIIADLEPRFSPIAGPGFRRLSDILLSALCIPIFFVAAQGFSVLYLFLLADLVCASAVGPVFVGLFSNAFDRRSAFWSIVAGLAAGGLLFPPPGAGASLLPAFAAALLMPAVVAAVLHAWGGMRA